MQKELVEQFIQKYKHKPTHAFFCPGRINLIGEHIDYNGGKVLPAAISLGTWLVCSFQDNQQINLDAIGFEESYSGLVPATKTGDYWYNYPLGVFQFLQKEIHTFKGLKMMFAGNLPIGSGLSSSASIEVLTVYALCILFGLDKSRKEIAVLAQKVENEFIGVHCGIMDQYAVANGKKGQALLLDCAAITHQNITAAFGNYELVIINTNKPRKLVESKYNERYSACMDALQSIQNDKPISHLCDLSVEEYLSFEKKGEVHGFWKRGLHVVEENERVKNAVTCLTENDIMGFGALLFQSHDSLKNLYEVSGLELDTIVDFCQTYPKCIGARMTGAGFGGCAIALVHEHHFEDFAVEIMMHYKSKTGYACGVYKAEISDGVNALPLED